MVSGHMNRCSGFIHLYRGLLQNSAFSVYSSFKNDYSLLVLSYHLAKCTAGRWGWDVALDNRPSEINIRTLLIIFREYIDPDTHKLNTQAYLIALLHTRDISSGKCTVCVCFFFS